MPSKFRIVHFIECYFAPLSNSSLTAAPSTKKINLEATQEFGHKFDKLKYQFFHSILQNSHPF